MSNIDIRKFVDINIKHHTTSSGTSTRDTVVCLVDEGAEVGPFDNIVSSYEEAYDILTDSRDVDVELQFCKLYFLNGGRKIRLLSTVMNEDAVVATLKSLPDEQILVAAPRLSPATFCSAFDTYDTEEDDNGNLVNYGVKTKFAIVRFQSLPIELIQKHIIAKYSTKGEVQACIAAYLSRIDVSKVGTINDYDFTAEQLLDGSTDYSEEADNDTLTACMTENLNVDMTLAGRIRNIGGNTLDGFDLVNEYALVLLQQTVSEKVLSVLTSKLRGEIGVAAIHTAIAQELQRYVKCGYLTTDKIYSDEDMTVEYNGKTYTIIEQDTPLLLGYQVKVLPYSSLSEEDKRKHAAPPIYIVLADSYSIRYVKISGEVF